MPRGDSRLAETRIEAMTKAALQGHDIGPFEPVEEDEYQSRCRQCGQTVGIRDDGLMYSLLDEVCAGENKTTDE